MTPSTPIYNINNIVEFRTRSSADKTSSYGKIIEITVVTTNKSSLVTYKIETTSGPGGAYLKVQEQDVLTPTGDIMEEVELKHPFPAWMQRKIDESVVREKEKLVKQKIKTPEVTDTKEHKSLSRCVVCSSEYPQGRVESATGKGMKVYLVCSEGDCRDSVRSDIQNGILR